MIRVSFLGQSFSRSTLVYDLFVFYVILILWLLWHATTIWPAMVNHGLATFDFAYGAWSKTNCAGCGGVIPTLGGGGCVALVGLVP